MADKVIVTVIEKIMKGLEYIHDSGYVLIGLAEVTLARLDRPGERAARVAEQLGHRGLRVEGRHVDRHVRLGRPRRGGVDRPRDQFLAGARLAAQQHRNR